MLAIEYHVHIWQVLPQLSCGDTCQIWMWFKYFKRYFCEIENFAYGEIDERSFSNPQPWMRNYTYKMMWCNYLSMPKRQRWFKHSLKLGHGWVITSHNRMSILLIIHDLRMLGISGRPNLPLWARTWLILVYCKSILNIMTWWNGNTCCINHSSYTVNPSYISWCHEMEMLSTFLRLCVAGWGWRSIG